MRVTFDGSIGIGSIMVNGMRTTYMNYSTMQEETINESRYSVLGTGVVSYLIAK